MKRVCLCLLFFSWCFAPAAIATTRSVDVNDQDCSDGGGDPYCSIQAAIDDSADGDEVIVQDGTYLIDTSHDGVRSIAFSDGLADDPEDQRTTRDIVVRSAYGPENCIIDCQGTSEDKCRGFDFTDDSAPNTAMVSGFTITGGYVTGFGGAIRIQSSSPTIENCIIDGNTADYGGAIAVIKYSSPIFASCVIRGNTAVVGHGGGIYLASTLVAPWVHNCVIASNSASGSGGGIFWGGETQYDLQSPKPRIYDTIVVANEAKRGGGIYADEEQYGIADLSILQGVDVIDNVSTWSTGYGYGGGASLGGRYANIWLVNSRFVGNRTLNDGRDGGGLELRGTGDSAETLITGVNLLIAGNTARDGAGVYLDSYFNQLSTLTNSLLVANRATRNGGGLRWSNEGSQQTAIPLANLVNWGNVASSGASFSFDPYSNKANVLYSDVQGTWSGDGNIAASPEFVGGPTGTWTDDAVFNCDDATSSDCDAVTTTFTDSSADWVVDEHIGKLLNPYTSQYRQSIVVSNTATTITVWGNFASLGGNGVTYQINDYRLTVDSPCVDAGDNTLVPPDATDMNGDYDTSEATPYDLYGYRRFVNDPRVEPDPGETGNGYANDIVDMGPFELLGECPDVTIADADPADGTQDSRHPHPPSDNSLSARQGIGSANTYTGGPEPITITLSSDMDGAEDPACWSLCETGIEEKEGTPALDDNFIESVDEVDDATYEIYLDRPISAGYWTTVTYLGSGDFVSYASLPADTQANGSSTSADVTFLIDVLNEEETPPYGDYSTDVDHSGVTNATDILEVIDLLNGASTFIEWNNASLDSNTCDPTYEMQMMGGGFLATSTDTEGASFVDAFVTFLVRADPVTGTEIDALYTVAAALADFGYSTLPGSELARLADLLTDPSTQYRSSLVRDKANEIAKRLTD